MLGAVFFVLVVTLLTGHYFLIERPRRVERASTAGPRAMPLRELISRLPAGVFLQPTFTWGQVRPGGEVEIGVHPLLLSLLGPDSQVETRNAGERVAKGDPLMRVGIGERSLVVRSPVAGSISMSNASAAGATDWQSRSDRTCLIQPERLSDEIPVWMLGQAAVDWTQAQYGRIRDHLLTRSADPQTGIALADGGELPVGVLARLGAMDWADFEAEFLSA
jgi:hypothetical protein